MEEAAGQRIALQELDRAPGEDPLADHALEEPVGIGLPRLGDPARDDGGEEREAERHHRGGPACAGERGASHEEAVA